MISIIGVDPGPTPGIVRLTYATSRRKPLVEVVQCSASLLYVVLGDLVNESTQRIAVEKFVVGRGSMRSGAAGEETRNQIGYLQRAYGPRLSVRTASEVKPWASDNRLGAAGVLDACSGMRHARDAGRHALFAAVRDCRMPDPLSRTPLSTLRKA